jgi:ketosteroid isomerase-like protein
MGSAPAGSTLQAYVDRQAVERILVEFWWDVDRNQGRRACDYFTEDALFDLGGKPVMGHDAIQTFYRTREARGARTTRHIVGNFLIEVSGERATALYVMEIFAADGDPVHPASPPNLLCDVEDSLVLGPDGRWRMDSHRLIALFESGVLVRPS